MEPGNCNLDGFEVCPIPLSHPDGGYGYKFIEQGKAFVFLTDNELDFQHQGGLSRAKYMEFCQGVDLLVHDTQYTEEEYKFTRGWGHSTFGEATDLPSKRASNALVYFIMTRIALTTIWADRSNSVRSEPFGRAERPNVSRPLKEWRLTFSCKRKRIFDNSC
jgi:hypothetical protein